ncbi:MAG: hypothetical protein AB2693_29475 [Candidatus Thiodiazotropha sp.]
MLISEDHRKTSDAKWTHQRPSALLLKTEWAKLHRPLNKRIDPECIKELHRFDLVCQQWYENKKQRHVLFDATKNIFALLQTLNYLMPPPDETRRGVEIVVEDLLESYFYFSSY